MGKHMFTMGRLSYLKDLKIFVPVELLKLAEDFEEKGLGVTFVGKDDKAIGVVGLKDKVRAHAKNAIALTKLFGVRSWVMLTGDNEKVAEAISKEVGLDEFHANLKPEEKLRFLRALKKQKRKIAMIGDGVNDAAALALADVGFAMGRRGADASIEASDVTLIRDDLLGVPNAILLSRKVFDVIEFNFVIWAATNAIGLFLVFGHMIGPVGASAYNFATDFLPIINVFSLTKKGSLFTPRS
jgi:P-type E1-E2 ATPase